ncbi:MAG TPA: hypothetical protein GXX29_04690 [Firmicutes bacterium]|nr:hypothetical protein [Bacillota bacterium]
MTDLAVFKATVSHEAPDRILYKASFSDDLTRRLVEYIGHERIHEHFGFWTPVFVSPRAKPTEPPKEKFARYWRNRDLPEGTTINAYGVASVPSGYYHFWGYLSPLAEAESLAEIESYPLPEFIDTESEIERLREQVKQRHAKGQVVAGSVGHIFEIAWQIRGYEQFITDLVVNPSWAQCLLERVGEMALKKAKAAAAAGVDYLHCGDDVADQRSLMFAPDIWRRFMLSQWRQVWQEARRINPDILIWYHSDGNIIDIIPDLIDAGLNILNPLQPECLDIDKVYRLYGSVLTFDGTIGTQSTMPFGTPQDVEKRVAGVIQAYGRSGGLIISPTHLLEPDVPVENVVALAEACRRYGRKNRSA